MSTISLAIRRQKQKSKNSCSCEIYRKVVLLVYFIEAMYSLHFFFLCMFSYLISCSVFLISIEKCRKKQKLSTIL
ncbi:hypothetical protein RJT34_12280 [Clitoria ternatea]|uniref:Uncharacterized protein n=1 Tax=Clitoria ternatea TaxID=43366 RepID=A0AAN9PKB9_CLITE